MKPPSQRLGYLDWLRGAGAVIMLQGHVFHSFLRTDLRNNGPFMYSQFVGGMPPAIFLFLLGVTYAFLMDSGERRGLSAGSRVFAALKRSGWLFVLAFAVRLQLWVFAAGTSPWTDLLKVDILNCMGFALLVLSPMAVFRTQERIRHCLVLAFAIAYCGPFVSALTWQGVPPLVKQYIAPDYASFGFFPWATYVAFGMSFGSVLRRMRPEDGMQTMQWVGWAGVGLTFSAWVLSDTPLTAYSNSEFWLNSPTLVFIKTGIVVMGVTLAWIWNQGETGESWSWLRQLGTTSMLVYWVHIELTYGRWFGYFKEKLSLGQTVAVALCMIAAMLLLSVFRTNAAAIWRTAKSWLPGQQPEPSQVAGD